MMCQFPITDHLAKMRHSYCYGQFTVWQEGSAKFDLSSSADFNKRTVLYK